MNEHQNNVLDKHPSVNHDRKGKSPGAFSDLAIALGLVPITLACIFVPPLSQSVIRFPLALGMVLFLPGYVFIAALYPGKADLGSLERAVLSVGFSIVLVPLLGYLLNYTSWGITLGTMAVSITLLSLLLLALAFFRRLSLPPEKRFVADFSRPLAHVKKLLFLTGEDGSVSAIWGLQICALLLLASVLGYLVVMNPQADRFTEFYINGPEGKIGNYPTNFTLGEKKPVIIGIVNHEGVPKEYDLAVTLTSGSQARRIFLDRMVLADNQTMEKVINLTPDMAGNQQNIRFLLYMEGSSADPYRECNLWVNVTDSAANVTVATGTPAINP